MSRQPAASALECLAGGQPLEAKLMHASPGLCRSPAAPAAVWQPRFGGGRQLAAQGPEERKASCEHNVIPLIRVLVWTCVHLPGKIAALLCKHLRQVSSAQPPVRDRAKWPPQGF